VVALGGRDAVHRRHVAERPVDELARLLPFDREQELLERVLVAETLLEGLPGLVVGRAP
jgi:hypothetical protein